MKKLSSILLVILIILLVYFVIKKEIDYLNNNKEVKINENFNKI